MEAKLEKISIWDSLSRFVTVACKGRDESHGHEHMMTVANSALDIYEEIIKTNKKYATTRVAILVATVAWLHDVNDHKYDKTGELAKKIEEFLKILLKIIDPVYGLKEGDDKLILDIINRISYSKENKIILARGKFDWKIVLGDEGSFVRDIVSDADKLEALGKIGLDRTIAVAKEFYYEEHKKGITGELLLAKVKEHAKEKLLRLRDEFIRTEPGKARAVEKHKELVSALQRFELDNS